MLNLCAAVKLPVLESHLFVAPMLPEHEMGSFLVPFLKGRKRKEGVYNAAASIGSLVCRWQWQRMIDY